MRNSNVAVFFVLLAWWIRTPIAHAATPFSTQRIIQSNYDKMNTAVARKDLVSLFSYFTADYVSVDAIGKKVSRTQNRQVLEQLCSNVLKITIVSKVRHVDQVGSTAEVTVESVMTMILFNPKTKQLVKGVGTTKYLDEWTREKNRDWLLKTNRVITSHSIISLTIFHHPLNSNVCKRVSSMQEETGS